MVQQVAYDQLTAKGYTGSVVALDPATGNILAMASTPSYDPNLLASHDGSTTTAAWENLSNDPEKPMVNRAISQTYPPGSTFKVITTAAALEAGATPDDQLTAASNITLPGTSTTLENYNGSTCGGGQTATLREAFARSCNTAFVELGIDTGADKMRETSAAFGIGENTTIPLTVADSTIGPIDDDAALGQSSIGQRDVALTPLQDAVIAATVANDGVRMAPNLVQQLQSPDLSDLSSYQQGHGPGDQLHHRGDAERPDDRLREQHQRRGQDPRGTDRIENRYRRTWFRPAQHPAARVVHRIRTRRRPEGRHRRHRRGRRRPRPRRDRWIRGRTHRPRRHRSRIAGEVT